MRRWVIVTVAALTFGACGGGDTAPAGRDAADVTSGAGATASQIDAGTERATDGVDADAAWSSFSGEVAVGIGDAVRTDATGFAQVDYRDGSLTRLDRDTTLQIVELSDSPDRPDVVVDLDVGRTWHRVQAIEGSGRFEVRTSVATAAVRGTAFVVDCSVDRTCTFLVLAGIVEVTVGGEVITLSAFERVEVSADGTAGDVEQLAREDALADDWVRRNLDRDDEAGFAAISSDGDDPSDAGSSAAPVVGDDGPVASDGQPVTVGSVLAATSGTTAVIIRPDGSTADVALGVPQLISADWLADGSIAYVDGGGLARMLPDGSGAQSIGPGNTDTITANIRGDQAIGSRTADGDSIAVWDWEQSVFFSESGDRDRLQWPAISPDGATVAAVDFEAQQLVLIDIASGSRQSRPAELIDGWLRWSSDGTRIVYTFNRSGVRFAGDDTPPGIAIHDVTSGAEQRFDGFAEADFVPDGTALIAASQTRVDQPPGSLMLIDVASGAVTEFRAGVFGSAIVFDGVTQQYRPWEIS